MMQGAQIAKAGTAIGFGRFVNFYNVDGELYAQLADATLGRPAHAFCLSQDVVAGDSVEFVLGGLHPGLAGMTPATRYFLGAAGGAFSAGAVFLGTAGRRRGVAGAAPAPGIGRRSHEGRHGQTQNHDAEFPHFLFLLFGCPAGPCRRAPANLRVISHSANPVRGFVAHAASVVRPHPHITIQRSEYCIPIELM